MSALNRGNFAIPGAVNPEKMIGPDLPSMAQQNAAAVAKVEQNKKSKNLRVVGGEYWVDQTLDDWPADDFRVFCGDLGNEVTDELLANAFRSLKSFQKAKVIRDKRTGKTKGFGFVSFAKPEDMIKALKEINGKYVGNRPIKLKKSQWQKRNVDSENNKGKNFDTLLELKSKNLKKFKKVQKADEKKKAKAGGAAAEPAPDPTAGSSGLLNPMLGGPLMINQASLMSAQAMGANLGALGALQQLPNRKS